MASNQHEQGKGGTDAGNQNSQKETTQSGSKSGGSKRGFAAMDEEQQREIASKGGQAAHQKGTAHEFDSEEARRAGQKGGEAVSRDRVHMAEIGRKGGESRQSAHRAADDSSKTTGRSSATRQGQKPDEK